MNTNREETEMTINELAKTLNTSSGEWLDAWIKATEPHATEADVEKFLELARQKQSEAQDLVQKLSNLMIDKRWE
jgi:hypothetical protein